METHERPVNHELYNYEASEPGILIDAWTHQSGDFLGGVWVIDGFPWVYALGVYEASIQRGLFWPATVSGRQAFLWIYRATKGCEIGGRYSDLEA